MSEKLADEIRKAVREEVSRVITNPIRPPDSSANQCVNTNDIATASTSSTNTGSSSTTMTFEDFYKKREKMRQGDFKSGKSSTKQKLAVKEVKDVDVEIKVCLVSQKDGVIEPRRGKSQIIRVKSSSSKEVLLSKAIEKHSLFDQSFDDTDVYTLLYPDFKEVTSIPGTADSFTLSGYKEASGKDYKRLTFYMISYDAFFDQREDVVHLESDDNISCPPSPGPSSYKQSYMDGSPSTLTDNGKSSTNELQGGRTNPWPPWEVDCSDSGCSGINDDVLLEYAIQQSKDEAMKAPPNSILESLQRILEGYEADDYTSIEITRKNIVPKTFEFLEDEDIKAHIIVRFIGEEGVDTGGVMREFFSEFFKGISATNELVRGAYPNLTFRHNLTALRERKFETLGKLVAVALINHCPGPHCFSVLLANALFNVTSVSLSLCDVPQECEYLQQLNRIHDCTDEQSFSRAVMEFPERFDMGYTKAIVHLNDKQDIIGACVRHIVVSSVAEELFSFRKGLSSFGVYDAISQFQDEAVKHFVFTEISVEEAKSSFEPLFSATASDKERETEVVYNWNQFLKTTSKGFLKGSVLKYDNLDDIDDIAELRVLTLQDILQFGSGSRYPNFKGKLLFDHDSIGSGQRVKANTCSLTIIIPMNARYCSSAKEFANNLMEDIFEACGFGFA